MPPPTHTQRDEEEREGGRERGIDGGRGTILVVIKERETNSPGWLVLAPPI